ncbi:conserved hypothetical exported protein [Taylorella equigenitalis 14/56]|uniref:Conserved hypothetical exported protein n=2 Tax=Taylorella equigenitalis TaxID=29575 RepID=I7IYK7_9BURK|nr:hypothetical protein B9Z30_03360 [Taylorella equigenitalis]KOS58432.1 hypothetical protein AM589_05985 [Taylorella equigenitalis]WDU47012.1 hypothetical protein KNO33_03300 [Taylorella equigenitalis]WDU48490.1 hypothetical protein KNO30_03325 [Taylorella equigenitalis]CCG17874.1 conserved hypothetical exported protein [Taylorella equigenitalis 14/56]
MFFYKEIFMKNLLKFLLVASATYSSIAYAGVLGDSNIPNNIKLGPSTAKPFGAGKPGIQIKGTNISINLEDGPIKHIGKKYNQTPIISGPNAATTDVKLMASDVVPVIGWFIKDPLGQVWFEKPADKDTEFYSVRQIADPKVTFAPKFGGLVIGKVPNLPSDTSVYFGEWGPRSGTPTQGSSTDLNLNNEDHTVWYVGKDETGKTTGLATAKYDVLGVNQHTPGKDDFYRGEITANFGNGSTGSMSGKLTRAGSPDVDFTGVQIDNSKGIFNNGVSKVEGRFYGKGASAMAGFATMNTTTNVDDVAFGGTKK